MQQLAHLLALSLLSLLPTLATASTADDWRTRSIYQVITDRFALPEGSSIDPKACNPAQQKICGGTWQSIIQNLDYIQGMGFSAVWIRCACRYFCPGLPTHRVLMPRADPPITFYFLPPSHASFSPVNQNIPGPTAYGDPYHGYWIADITQLNDRFGTADDLKQLSNELHQRDMYLMVDVVVNNVASTTNPPNYNQYLFKDRACGCSSSVHVQQ